MIFRKILFLVFVGACVAITIHPAQAQLQFVEVGSTAGIGSFTMEEGGWGGVAASDFDDDGDIDLFLPNGDGAPDQLYRNLGDGHFEEIAAEVGVASLDHGRVALWFDYDGDHRLDLFVGGDCREQADPCVMTMRQYRQTAEGTFEEVALDASIAEFIENTEFGPFWHLGGMAAGDINNDGYLDLAIPHWRGKETLFLNNGDGTFTDISVSSGIGNVTGTYQQHVMHDFNDDGWLDIHTTNDGLENRLWINQADGTFVDMAPEAGTDDHRFSMGTTLGDYDNDGDLDIYITDINRNKLFRNDSFGGILQFTKVAEEAQVVDVDFAWGCTFFDADNDGLLDLAVTNGWYWDRFRDDPSRLFLNQGGDPVTFADISDLAGFNDTLFGSALIALDYDRDGDLDLAQTTEALGDDPSRLRLLQNQPGPESENNNFLVIKPRMDGPNHRAIGALVRVEVDDLRITRLITAGTSFMGQEPAEAHFGLGTATEVDEVVIEWPDGTESQLLDVPANQVVTVWNTFLNGGEGEGESETGGEGESAEGGEGDSEGEREGEGDSEGEVGEEERQNENNRPLTCSASSLAASTKYTFQLDTVRSFRDFGLLGNSLTSYLARSYYRIGP